MSKYEALGAYLAGQATQEIAISFVEIEQVIGSDLPRSAYVHRPWWSNNPSNSAMTRVWLDAGFRTERVDMAARKLVFRRVRAAQGNESSMFAVARQPMARPTIDPGHEGKTRRHPLFGAMKGTFTIDPDWDLTLPAMPEWADFIDEKYGPEERK